MPMQIEFLRLILGIDAVSMGDDQRQRVQKWPTPKKIMEVQSLLGLLPFFRKFIYTFSPFAV